MTKTINWIGKSGQSYPFFLFPHGTEFHAASAVYIACKQVAPETFSALYVGEAESLYNRLNVGGVNHQGLLRAAREGMTHICAMAVDGRRERLRIELDLRHALDPVCNREAVPASGLLNQRYD